MKNKIEPAPKKEGWEALGSAAEALSMIMVKLGYTANSEEDVKNELSRKLELIDKCNKEYYYWDRVKYQPIGEDSTEDFWHILKMFRNLSSQKIKFGNYIFQYYITKHLAELLHKFDLQLGGQLSSVIPEQDKNQYLISSIMEEAIASSQIEGAVTTRQVAKEMLRKNLTPRDKSQHMIFNNYQISKYLSEIKSENMTPELLCEIQRVVTKNTLENPMDGGQFRNSNDISVVDNINEEIVFTPPQVSELPELVNSLCDFFNHDIEGNFVHPIVKASILHFMVAYIHPFVDGNGRTARAVFYWYLMKKGYWLVEFLSISRIISQSKTKYYKAFIYTETDDNDLTYFIHYQLHTLKQALDSLQQYIAKKVEEKRQAIDFQKVANINQRQAMILRDLDENQDWIFNVKEIENRYGISNQTARTDVAGLVKLAFIEVSNVNAKEQKYYKSPQFDRLLGRKSL